MERAASADAAAQIARRKMGLDSVELVMAVEDAFGFSIPDADAAALDTVGKLYDYIMTHRFQDASEACLSGVVFYGLRRAIMSVLHVPREQVRVASELATLIPRRRRKAWRELEQATLWRLPELKRPTAVVLLAILATIGLTPAAVICLPSAMHLAPVLAMMLAVVAGVVSWVTKPFATEFRPEFATMGNLTKAVLARNYGTVSDKFRSANANEVWESLRSIIVEQLGVRPGDVTKEANFVKDLGVD